MLSNLKPSPARAAETARLLRALANPHRLLILCQLLQHGEVTAGELAQRLGLAPSALSQHLARMRAAGLIRHRRAARTLRYRVGDACEGRLTALLRGICVAGDAPEPREPRGGAPTTEVLNLVFAGVASGQTPDFWQTPAIAGFGPVHALPEAAFRPAAKGTHRLAFAITRAGQTADQVCPGLVRVARALNLYVGAGVSPRRVRIRAVIYGPATASVLDDAHHRQELGVANPNLPLLDALRAQGVEVAVCGQAVAGRGYGLDWISPSVSLALSAITAMAELQRQGYALIPS